MRVADLGHRLSTTLHLHAEPSRYARDPDLREDDLFGLILYTLLLAAMGLALLRWMG